MEYSTVPVPVPSWPDTIEIRPASLCADHSKPGTSGCTRMLPVEGAAGSDADVTLRLTAPVNVESLCPLLFTLLTRALNRVTSAC